MGGEAIPFNVKPDVVLITDGADGLKIVNLAGQEGPNTGNQDRRQLPFSNIFIDQILQCLRAHNSRGSQFTRN